LLQLEISADGLSAIDGYTSLRDNKAGGKAYALPGAIGVGPRPSLGDPSVSWAAAV
jgi:hypothetical protein